MIYAVLRQFLKPLVPPLARALDFLAGPLAFAAAGLTFFAAYDLTATQPPDLFTGVQPTVVHSASAQGAAPLRY